MKIFISWSKSNSNSVALVLKRFIKNIFDNQADIDFFISSEDIYAGDTWFQTISMELKKSNLAIICFTNENRFSKWLDFESGAIAFNAENGVVCPFLFDIEKLDEGNPLKSYQLTRNNRKELLRLIKTIGREAAAKLSDRHLETLFDSEYSQLEKDFANILLNSTAGIESEYFDTHIYPVNVKGTQSKKLFLGTPMASINSVQYKENRDEILELMKVINATCKFDIIYSPVTDNIEPDEFDGQEKAMEIDFSELKQSEFYMLFILKK